MDDTALILLLQQRDEDAVGAVREKYGAYCRSIAMSILGDERDAEECLNDALLRLWDSVPPEQPLSLRAYIGRLTRNVSLNVLRDSQRQKRGGGEPILALGELSDCVPDHGTPERSVENAEISACIDRWLVSLPQDRRVAFVRRYWYLDSIAELSKRMGWSKSKTVSLLSRLRSSLREKLNSEGIEI